MSSDSLRILSLQTKLVELRAPNNVLARMILEMPIAQRGAKWLPVPIGGLFKKKSLSKSINGNQKQKNLRYLA